MRGVGRQGFERSLAYVIGVNDYGPPVSRLTTPRRDAVSLAAVLRLLHGYTVRLLTRNVTLDALTRLRRQMAAEVGAGDRVLFYFAGHGIPPDDSDPKARRSGYLLPQSVLLGDRATCLAMDELHEDLHRLPCRHLLVILDCCYAGRFRWAATRPGRDLEPVPEVRIYAERYRRFVRQTAWQLITSAGQNEKAADVLFGDRGEAGRHSPFAETLLAGLRGEADARQADGGDARGDGVIPVYELYAYLERIVAERTGGRQTVSYFPLDRHDTGQYVFLVPGVHEEQLRLPPALPLLAQHNPYLGLARYDFTPAHEGLFKGRARATAQIRAEVETRPLTVVVGPSGSGKSSLVRAGVMRQLAMRPDWLVLQPVQPGSAPLVELAKGLAPLVADGGQRLTTELRSDVRALARVVTNWMDSPDGRGRHLLLCVDQFEELVTQRIADPDRDYYCRLLREALLCGVRLHMVLTVRSDYEGRFGEQPSSPPDCQPPLSDLWTDALRDVSPLGRDDLREIVVGPATARALVFDPPELSDELVDAVIHHPGALPLLSFTLWKLYEACATRVVRSGELEDRRLTRDDYQAIGFLAGALSRHADDLRDRLPSEDQASLRRVMMRLVDFAGPEAVKRRVPVNELLDFDEPERDQVERVLGGLVAERLVTGGNMVPRADKTETVPCVEPAHDALIRGWTTLGHWIEDEQAKVRAEPPRALPLVTRRRLADDAAEWADPDTPAQPELLWHNSPHLPLATRHLAAEPLAFNRTEAGFLKASEERRRVRRRRTWSGVAGAFAVVAGLAVVASILYVLADDRARLAEARRLEVEQRARVADCQRLAAQSQFVLRTHPQRGLLLAVEALRVLRKDDPRIPDAEQALHDACSRTGGRTLHLLGGPVSLAGWSGDGRRLAAAGDDKTLRVWDLARPEAEPVVLAGHRDTYRALALSGDGRRLAARGDGPTMPVWDLADPKAGPILLINHPEMYGDPTLSGDGRRLVIAGNDGLARMWDLDAPTAEPIVLPGPKHGFHVLAAVVGDRPPMWIAGDESGLRAWDLSNLGAGPTSLGGFQGRIRATALGADGRRLATGGEDGVVRISDLADLRAAPIVLPDHQAGIQNMVLGGDGRLIVAGIEGTVWIWDLAGSEPRRVATLRGHAAFSDILAAVWSGDRRRLVIAGRDAAIRAWDIYSRSVVPPDPIALFGHEGDSAMRRIIRAGIRRDDGHLLTVGDDGMLREWDPDHLEAQPTLLPKYRGGARGLALSDDGRRLVVVAGDLTARMWDLADPRAEPVVLRGHSGRVYGMALSGDGRRLVIVGGGQRVRVWDLDDPKAMPITLPNNLDGTRAIALSGDGRRLVTAGTEGTRVWDLSNPTALPAIFPDHRSRLRAVALSGDGRRLVTAGTGGIRVWDLDDPKATPVDLPDDQGGVDALVLSGDGRRLVSFGADHSTQLRDLAHAGVRPAPLRSREGDIRTVALSDDGRRLAAIGDLGVVLIWDMAYPQTEPLVLVDDRGAHTLALSGDGRRLITAETEGIRVWNLDLDELIALAGGVAGRNLSLREWRRYFPPDRTYRRTFDDLPVPKG